MRDWSSNVAQRLRRISLLCRPEMKQCEVFSITNGKQLFVSLLQLTATRWLRRELTKVMRFVHQNLLP